MIKFTQSKVVIKNSKGDTVQGGNCYPTAIACLLEISPTDVPNIETLWEIGIGYAYDVMSKWLEKKGLEIRSDFQYLVFHERSTILPEGFQKIIEKWTDEEKDKLKNQLKDKYYLVSGLSPRGVQHIVIYQNGVMVHDPHPTRDGLLKEEMFEHLVAVLP